MPQEFQVLQCYSCHTFQVHQVKKTVTKWACKMCGEKQSLKKVFGRGTGADCRQHVQRLNTMRGEIDQTTCTSSKVAQENVKQDWQLQGDHIDTEPMNSQGICQSGSSMYKTTKWNAFIASSHFENNSDDDIKGDDDDDDRYTTDSQKFKQGCKRKRNSKGANYSRTGYTKRSEFATGSSDNTEPYGSYIGDDRDGDRKLNKPTVSETFWKRQRYSYTDNKPEMYLEESPQLRENKWDTSEPNDTSSQESFPSSFEGSFTSRIKSDTNTPRNMCDVKNSGAWNRIKCTEKNTKWGDFTESDAFPQESEDNNSLDLDEASSDSRPYVTFDPNDIDSSFVMASRHESGNVSSLGAHNDENDDFGRETNGNGSSESSYSLSNGTCNKSKWTGFLTSENRLNQSVEKFENGAENGKQKSNVGRHVNSKWAVYTGEDNSRGKQDENRSLQASVKNDKLIFNDNSSVQSLNENYSAESARCLKSVHVSNKCNIDCSKNIVGVKAMFSADDLDDADFEL